MAAPNSQPCGDRPAPAAAHVHPEHQGPMPSSGWNDSDVYDNGVTVNDHGTPAPVGDGKRNPLK